MTKTNLIEIKEEKEISFLNETDAIVEEGLDISSIGLYAGWASDLAGTVKDPLDVYLIHGDMLNHLWGLTGNNRYPDDLNIVAIPLNQLAEPEQLSLAKFEVGARWWSDVRDNNLRREKEKFECIQQ